MSRRRAVTVAVAIGLVFALHFVLAGVVARRDVIERLLVQHDLVAFAQIALLSIARFTCIVVVPPVVLGWAVADGHRRLIAPTSRDEPDA